MRVLLPFIFLLAYTPKGYSCDCGLKPNINSAIKEANLILSGRVIQCEIVGVIINDSEWVINSEAKSFEEAMFKENLIKYTLEVEKSFKNKVNKTVIVYSNQLNSSCGYTFEIGKTYIVYAIYDIFRNAKSNTYDPVFFTNSCSRTDVYSEDEDKLITKIMNKYRKSH